MSDFPAKKLKDIKPLLPKDCWFAEYDDAAAESEKVFHLVGNQDLETLPLDFFNYEDDDAPVLILIEGNLHIRNIYNEETDGAIGLIVLGSLTADNIVVGGNGRSACARFVLGRLQSRQSCHTGRHRYRHLFEYRLWV